MKTEELQNEQNAPETQARACAQRQDDAQTTAVIAGLSADFDCVSYADLPNNTIRDCRVSDQFSGSIDGWSDVENYAARMMLFANTMVIPSERDDFLNKVRVDTVREGLAKRPVYYAGTRISLMGKERVFQIKYVSDPAKPGHVILGFHNINDAIEQRRKSFVEATALDRLTSDFECIAYVELADNRVTPCRISEKFAKLIPGWRTVTDYAVRVRLLADALVIDEDRERFLMQTSPEQVINGVANDAVYYVVFRVRIDDSVQYYRAKFIQDSGFRSNVILGIHNIDSEKKRELERHAEEDAAKMKSGFLTQMSRDILAPLNSIRRTLLGAQENLSDAELLQKSLEKADVTAEYLYGLVNDVLNMTREREDKIVISHEPMNMRTFVEHCASAIEEQVQEKKLHLVRYFDDITHPYVLFDPPHLRQVILNLINNAMKYTPEGGQITFRVSELTSGDRSVTFKIDIADTGHGMDRAILEHIWDVLAQRADTSTPGNTGTGLGLAVCKMLTDMMGATLSVDSKIGEGSCFSVIIPMDLDPDAYAELPGEGASILNGMHILLAEDNELNRDLVSERLSDSGAIVTLANNGRFAVEIFRTSGIGDFDLVLMDSLMPEMDGVAATREIRAMQRADAATVTIIGMSTGITNEDMAAFQSAGISAYVEKPVQVPVLVNTLLTCIHSRSQLLEKELAAATETSTRDALTGVRNRAAYERTEIVWNREIAAGKAEPFALLFCDVNNLKYTNDTFGHDRGDELIRNACRQICDVFRHSTVFRMGGDEFAAILHKGDYENYEALLAQLAPSEQYGMVSIACGLAVFDPEQDRDLGSVMKRADAKMYENKRKMKCARSD